MKLLRHDFNKSMLLRSPIFLRGARSRASTFFTAKPSPGSTQPEAGIAESPAATLDTKAREQGRFPWRIDRIVDRAAQACLLLGARAILKASMMDRACDAVVCLAGSIGACTLVCYLYFQRD